MKRLMLALVAGSMLAAPVAQAGPSDNLRRETVRVQKHVGAPGAHHFDRKVVVKKKVVTKTRWVRGHRVPIAQRKVVVRDFQRRGLHRPARGQQWVRVGNDYLLIGISTGIIVALAAGR